MPPLGPRRNVGKLLLDGAVRYLKCVLVVLVVSSIGVLMGGQSMTQKQKLEEKMDLLQKDNDRLIAEIKSLERRVTLLRSDPRTVEKVAKRRLGMARPDETVYILGKSDTPHASSPVSEHGLAKDGNIP